MLDKLVVPDRSEFKGYGFTQRMIRFLEVLGGNVNQVPDMVDQVTSDVADAHVAADAAQASANLALARVEELASRGGMDVMQPGSSQAQEVSVWQT